MPELIAGELFRFADGAVLDGFVGTFNDGTLRSRLTSPDGYSTELVVQVFDVLTMRSSALVELVSLELERALRRLEKTNRYAA
jgi:hypothetical protein